MNDMRVHAVVLVNQKKDNFWPSLKKKLSQDDIGFFEEALLVEEALGRISDLVPQQRRWVCTSTEYEQFVAEQVSDKIAGVLVEPEQKGTASAILFSALLISATDPEAILVFLPSEHYIPQIKKFSAFLEHAIDFVNNHDQIALLGFQPTYAATEYEYISYVLDETYPAVIKAFHERPDVLLAHEYYENKYLWNSGIIAAKANVLIEEVKKLAPELYESVSSYIQGLGDYCDVPKLSFNTAILHKSTNLSVFPVDCIWHDMANMQWASQDIVSGGMQVGNDNYIEINSRNNLIEAEGDLVALVGVENLCVIKRDDIVLVVHRDHIQKVKQIIDELKKGKEEYI